MERRLWAKMFPA